MIPALCILAVPFAALLGFAIGRCLARHEWAARYQDLRGEVRLLTRVARAAEDVAVRRDGCVAADGG
jgi:hypothetical protein